MTEPWVLAVGAASGAAAGLLIGSVGVGGIILVPILIQVPGIQVKSAVATCMFAYIAAGLAGLASYARQNSIDWGRTGWMLLGAAPAAVGGAASLRVLGDLQVRATQSYRA